MTPRRADASMKMFRIDLFFQQPDRWRATAWPRRVLDRRQAADVERRQTEVHREGRPRPGLVPGEFVDQFRKRHASAVLSSISMARCRREPVKSDEVSASQGIDVFDYAQNASNKWRASGFCARASCR
jgi:hypothetical protein